jgi:hypothetical protein
MLGKKHSQQHNVSNFRACACARVRVRVNGSESDRWRELGIRFKSTSPATLNISTDLFSFAFVASTLNQLEPTTLEKPIA